MRVDLSDVRRALESEALVPCFQPRVELRTGRLAGFEVLARWQHPEHGLVLPENFITIADHNGLIGQLTEQILRKAFLMAPLLPEPLFLAVNASPIQIWDLSLPRLISAVAYETGYPLERLTVEITESALVNNLERARKVAIELKTMGCTLVLDDFGTEYSSLRHIQSLPFSELKIDRTFVQSITGKPESHKIAATAVGLGLLLGIITVAVGVERAEQADILLGLGCDLGQGWLYGRPLPGHSIRDMVATAPRMLSKGMSSQGNEGAISSLNARSPQRLAQLQAIYNNVPVGLCFLDRNLRHVSLNQRLAEMDGVPLMAHIGKTVPEMIPDVFPLVEPLLLRALQGEAIEAVEAYRPPHQPGEPGQTWLMSCQPVFDEAQEVIGVSVAVMDVTALTGDNRKATGNTA